MFKSAVSQIEPREASTIVGHPIEGHRPYKNISEPFIGGGMRLTRAANYDYTPSRSAYPVRHVEHITTGAYYGSVMGLYGHPSDEIYYK